MFPKASPHAPDVELTHTENRSTPPDFGETKKKSGHHGPIFYRIDQWGQGNSFPDQLGRGVDPGFFGPNFQFVLVPEPSHAALAAVAFLLIVKRRRRG